MKDIEERRKKIRDELIGDVKNPRAWYTKTDEQRDERNRDVIVTHPECPYASPTTGRVAEHRYVWWLNHPHDSDLGYGDVIHHINGNHKDNRIENLMRVKSKDHRKIHGITISVAKRRHKSTTDS